MAYGFRFDGRLSGALPTIQILTVKTSETLTRGDLVNLETGEADLAATDDAGFLGVVLEGPKVGVDSVTNIQCITDADAVYAVDDANARVIGATLDLVGATGAQHLTTSTHADFTVVSDSSATEPTRVVITHGEHWLS